MKEFLHGPRLTSVKSVEFGVLDCEFENGDKKVYNFHDTRKFESPMFSGMSEEEFMRVKMNRFGSAVVWDDVRDLAAWELWTHGKSKSSKRKMFGVMLTDDERAALTRLANARSQTMSDVVRDLIVEAAS